MSHRCWNLLVAGSAAALALLGPRGAAAQSGAGGMTTASPLGAGDFTFKFEAWDPDQKDWVQLNDTEAQFFFNRARCECNGDTTHHSGEVVIAIQPATTTEAKVRNNLAANGVNAGGARLYVGGTAFNCLSPSTVGVTANCLNLMDPSNYEAEIPGGISSISSVRVWESQPIPVAWLFGSAQVPMCGPGGGGSCDTPTSCGDASIKRTLYLWAETTGTGIPDSPDIKKEISVVGEVALTPTNVQVRGGNEALEVSWSWPAGQNPSAASSIFKGVQIFCVRGASNQVFEDGEFGQSYMTAVTTCPDTVGANVSGLAYFDPKYLCSGLLPAGTNSHRITGLQNGIPYGIAVAAIDKYLNVSELSTIVYAEPIPTVDFYTEYKRMGGDAQGGYCAIARGRPGPGMLAVAGLGLALALVLRRRRRGRRRPPGAGAAPLALALAVGTLLSGTAWAQPAYDDDMMVASDESEGWNGTPRNFAIEARFGLYTPNVDSEIGGGTGPHAFIFGDSRRPMWQLEFDWQVLQVFGTLAVGASVGYFKENAKACELETLADDPSQPMSCTRSGDNTSLRLIPFAALLVYRFDVLAQHWKIPIAPYGKVGLNYTLWKVTDGNGHTPSVGGGRGAGGTLGWQAAVGIAFLLDFLDPAAARGFDADAGVNHTYAFFELTTIQASGLGRKNALHVGDNTWFAGLLFEF